jgi:hypothetical protein
MTEINAKAAISLPDGFRFGHLSGFAPKLTGTPTPTPSLGPLAAFVGAWKGNGFNTIFRPDNSKTPTPLPIPFLNSDNILELNLTSESLTFSPSLGSVPNRGFLQGDIFLNGIPYLQAISDVTISGHSPGIHVEPGLWMMVPLTTVPEEPQTVVRMASIPHGTTIEAQGTSSAKTGPPIIPLVDITPTAIGGGPIRFASQTAVDKSTPRIPQDLTAFISAGTITQAMLDDPNTLLRSHIAGQTITATTQISISTSPGLPLFGGGTDNIAFLQGNPPATTPNAQATLMTATFWIETVQHIIEVPIFKPGQPPLLIEGETPTSQRQPVPRFSVTPPIELTAPRSITVRSTQIQYSQTVNLKFNNLIWPHVSVATLVPADPIVVPPSVWN